MSFVKIKKENSIEFAGLKTSVRNGQVCSSGSDSFDFVIGGGIELNSLFLIGKKIFNFNLFIFKHFCLFFF